MIKSTEVSDLNHSATGAALTTLVEAFYTNSTFLVLFQIDQKDFESLKDVETNHLPKELQLLYKVRNYPLFKITYIYLF